MEYNKFTLQSKTYDFNIDAIKSKIKKTKKFEKITKLEEKWTKLKARELESKTELKNI